MKFTEQKHTQLIVNKAAKLGPLDHPRIQPILAYEEPDCNSWNRNSWDLALGVVCDRSLPMNVRKAACKLIDALTGEDDRVTIAVVEEITEEAAEFQQ